MLLQGAPARILLFALLIGFAATMAEPAPVAIEEQSQEASSGRIREFSVRVIVALGVAVGIFFGAYRILVGGQFHCCIITAHAVAVVLVFSHRNTSLRWSWNLEA